MEPNNRTAAVSRRAYLGHMASFAAGALLANHGFAQPLASSPRRIDCHDHFASPGFLSVLADIDAHPVKNYPSWTALGSWKQYSPARTIEAMDKGGAETAIVSCTAPGIWFGNPVQMQGLKIVAGASQIVFGTDYPFGSGIANHAIGLQKCGFSPAELRGINRDNLRWTLSKYAG